MITPTSLTHINISGKRGILFKDLMNENKSNIEFPTSGFREQWEACGRCWNIAEKIKKYFIMIRPSLASAIDVSNKPAFNIYLSYPCTSSFHFTYTDSSDTLHIIQGLKLKLIACLNHISSKVLKCISRCRFNIDSIEHNHDQIAMQWHVLSEFIITKMIRLFKEGDIQLFGNNCTISVLSPVSRCLGKLHMTNFMHTFNLMHVSMSFSTALENNNNNNHFIDTWEAKQGLWVIHTLIGTDNE